MAGNLVHVLESSAWKTTFEKYGAIMKDKSDAKKKTTKSAALKTLDNWYQSELPALITSRPQKFITKEELCQLMKWKLTRGKFRPRLENMVKENSSELVEKSSKLAFKALPNTEQALKELCVLRAVGPATASAILAAGDPANHPFMADEALYAIYGKQSINYNVSTYLKFKDEVNRIKGELNKSGSVELFHSQTGKGMVKQWNNNHPACFVTLELKAPLIKLILEFPPVV